MTEIRGINRFDLYTEGGIMKASFEAMVKEGKGFEIKDMSVEVNAEILELSTKLQEAVIKAKEGK